MRGVLGVGIEFLRDGELNVMRHDAAELLAIKHGEWRLERIKGEAEHLFRRAEDVYDRSTLPVRPDPARVNLVCRTMVEIALSERGDAPADVRGNAPRSGSVAVPGRLEVRGHGRRELG